MTKIEILGANCGYCRAMEATAREAATRLGLDCEIVKVTEPQKFIDYNVRAIPTLVVNGKMKASGRVVPLEEMLALLNGN
jgi:small redox-active disulfide protein 2